MVEFFTFALVFLAGGFLGLNFIRRNTRKKVGKKEKQTLLPYEMVGREVIVVTTVGQGFRGTVKMDGELWSARMVGMDGTDWPAEIEPGRRVRVVEQKNLLLLVEPLPPLNKGW